MIGASGSPGGVSEHKQPLRTSGGSLIDAMSDLHTRRGSWGRKTEEIGLNGCWGSGWWLASLAEAWGRENSLAQRGASKQAGSEAYLAG